MCVSELTRYCCGQWLASDDSGRSHESVGAQYMRKLSDEGLAQLVEPLLSADLFCRCLFIFLPRKRDRA